MYLLYADESGDLTDPDSKVFVVAAVAIHEDAVRPLAAEINGTMNKFLGRKVAESLELHGSPLPAVSRPERLRHFTDDKDCACPACT